MTTVGTDSALTRAIRDNIAASPGCPALVTAGRSVGWEDLERIVRGARAGIARFAGSRVAVWTADPAAQIAAMAAAQEAGASVLLIPPYLAREQALATAARHSFEALGEAGPEGVEFGRVPGVVAAQDDRPFLGILTSGTTGDPKCVRHTWESLAGAVRRDESYRGRAWFMGYQLAHFAGLQVFVQAFLNGGTLVVPASFDPREGRELILGQRVSYVNCTPTYLRRLLMTDEGSFRPEGVRKVTLGGEISDQALLDLAKARLPGARITHVYASSELGAVLEVHDGREGFDAALLADGRLRIVDGELQIRPGARSMRGYLGHPHESGDGWVPTRDLVEARDGRVRFMGRRDDVINVGGYKVSPLLVEKVILEDPEVIEVAVSGRKNALSGNLVLARVRTRPGSDAAAVRARLLAACRAALPGHMVPRLFEFAEGALSQGAKLVRAES